MWRVNRIFLNPTIKRIKVTPKDVILPLCAIMAVNIVILSVWTAMAPLHWVREAIAYDAFGQVIETVGECDNADFLPYIISLEVVNMGEYNRLCVRTWLQF